MKFRIKTSRRLYEGDDATVHPQQQNKFLQSFIKKCGGDAQQNDGGDAIALSIAPIDDDKKNQIAIDSQELEVACGNL